MNAFVRNECEKELLNILKEVIVSLDIDINIESEAFKEGGLQEIWNFLGKNGVQITLIVTLFGIILSRTPIENKELVKLQIENLELDNEIKKDQLKKIKKDILSQEDITDEIVEQVLKILDKDYKILWHKSNFYKKLSLYPKVLKIATQKLTADNNPFEDEITIEKQQFGSFILHSDTFPPNIDEEAIIDIISPVLQKGYFSWKGFYQDEIINFEMGDNDFKDAVLKKEIEFINGTAIKSVLQQNRKIDETGLVKVVKNKVLTVFEIIDGNNTIETEQGKRYIRDKKLLNNQLKLEL